jgi:hypothetical protein
MQIPEGFEIGSNDICRHPHHAVGMEEFGVFDSGIK